jgi:hypothetical protein
MAARLRVLNCFKAGKAVGPLAQSFEKVLYQAYRTAGAVRQIHGKCRDHIERPVQIPGQTPVRYSRRRTSKDTRC